jgi:hypothetical protein
MKKQIPQLMQNTGISADYRNQYCWMYVLFSSVFTPQERNERILKMSAERYFKRYEEWFDPNIYEIDFSNPRIDLLNQIADYINLRREQKRLNVEELVDLADCAHDLILR